MFCKSLAITIVAAALTALSACNASSYSDGDRSPGGSAATITEGCHSSDPSHLCIGVKYVVYKRADGRPVATEDTVVSNLAEINRIWKECDIGFQVEKLEFVDPTLKGLSHGTAAATETEQIRQAYAEPNTFLIATTEEWNTTKNAWTNPPGSATHGAVIEGAVANYPSIIAHELGHYMSLDHVAGPSTALMYYAIVPHPDPVSAGECAQARASVMRDWPQMRR